jgi:hypothetical protein
MPAKDINRDKMCPLRDKQFQSNVCVCVCVCVCVLERERERETIVEYSMEKKQKNVSLEVCAAAVQFRIPSFWNTTLES